MYLRSSTIRSCKLVGMEGHFRLEARAAAGVREVAPSHDSWSSLKLFSSATVIAPNTRGETPLWALSAYVSHLPILYGISRVSSSACTRNYLVNSAAVSCYALTPWRFVLILGNSCLLEESNPQNANKWINYVFVYLVPEGTTVSVRRFLWIGPLMISHFQLINVMLWCSWHNHMNDRRYPTIPDNLWWCRRLYPELEGLLQACLSPSLKSICAHNYIQQRGRDLGTALARSFFGSHACRHYPILQHSQIIIT